MADNRMLSEGGETRLDDVKYNDDDVIIETTVENLTGDDIDKGWAWVVLFASWMTYVLMGGSIASGGLFYIYMLESFDGNPTEIAWVGSLYSGLHCLLGPAGSYLCNRFSSRHCMIIGGIIVSTSLAVSSQVTSLWLMFITFGILSGSGVGLVMAPLFFSPGYYFVKKRSLASGIGATGFSVGVILFPILLTSLRDYYGWRGCMLIFAGLMFNTCLCGMIMRPSSIERRRSRTVRLKTSTSTTNQNHPKTTRHQIIYGKLRKCMNLRNIRFSFLCLADFLGNLSLNIVFLHLPRYVMTKDTSTLELKSLFLVIGLSGITGKLLLGFGTGRVRKGQPLDKICLLIGAYSILGTVQFLLPSISHSQYGRIAYSLFTGCYIGVEPTVLVPLTVELVGITVMSSALGAILFCVGAGFVVGPPIAATIQDSTGDYRYSFYFAGLTYLLASVSCMVVVYLSEKKIPTKKKFQGENIISQNVEEHANNGSLGCQEKVTEQL